MMRDRAITEAQKEDVLRRLFEAWKKAPAERLGQFLSNVMDSQLGEDFFFVEDYTLVQACERRTGSARKTICSTCFQPVDAE